MVDSTIFTLGSLNGWEQPTDDELREAANRMGEARLVYSLLCDDIRIELGNKISLMGVFENIFFPVFPSTLLKFTVVNHWEGEGAFETYIRVLGPDGRDFAVSSTSTFTIEGAGYADNITFFTNIVFDKPGVYVVQTWLDGNRIAERPLFVHLVTAPPTSVN